MKIIENLVVEHFVEYKRKRISTYSDIHTHNPTQTQTHTHTPLEYNSTLKWRLFLYVL